MGSAEGIPEQRPRSYSERRTNLGSTRCVPMLTKKKSVEIAEQLLRINHGTNLLGRRVQKEKERCGAHGPASFFQTVMIGHPMTP